MKRKIIHAKMATMVRASTFWIVVIVLVVIAIAVTIFGVLSYLNWRRAEGELEDNICPIGPVV